jgi:hypothetical protein
MFTWTFVGALLTLVSGAWYLLGRNNRLTPEHAETARAYGLPLMIAGAVVAAPTTLLINAAAVAVAGGVGWFIQRRRQRAREMVTQWTRQHRVRDRI